MQFMTFLWVIWGLLKHSLNNNMVFVVHDVQHPPGEGLHHALHAGRPKSHEENFMKI